MWRMNYRITGNVLKAWLPDEVEFEWFGVVETAVELLLDNKLSTQPDGYLWEPAPSVAYTVS